MLFDFGFAFAALTKASAEATTPASVNVFPIPEIESPRTTITTALPEPGPAKSDGPLVTKNAINSAITATMETKIALRLLTGVMMFHSYCDLALIEEAPRLKRYQWPLENFSQFDRPRAIHVEPEPLSNAHQPSGWGTA